MTDRERLERWQRRFEDLAEAMLEQAPARVDAALWEGCRIAMGRMAEQVEQAAGLEPVE